MTRIKRFNRIFTKILSERGYSFAGAEKETVQDVQAKSSYIAVDYEDELQKDETSSELKQNHQL